MSRSDFGKSKKIRFVSEKDPGRIGYSGPFLKMLSGQDVLRTMKYDWWNNGNSGNSESKADLSELSSCDANNAEG